jgi:ribosomal protein L37AE/L43A
MVTSTGYLKDFRTLIHARPDIFAKWNIGYQILRMRPLNKRSQWEGFKMLFNCGNCGLTQEVSEKFANKTVKCPKCKASVTIGAGIPQDNHRYSISEFIKRTSQKDKGQGSLKATICLKSISKIWCGRKWVP